MAVAELIGAEPGAATRRFLAADGRLIHEITVGERTAASSITLPPAPGDPLGDWWTAYLRGERPNSAAASSPIRVVELFSGAGGLANGFRQSCAELGLGFE